MKNLLIISFLLAAVVAKSQSFFEASDEFFSKYVEGGSVKYSQIKENPEALEQLVDEIANHNLSNKKVTADYMKAFYINAYNILVIKQVVDRYPVFGPLKVKGFFDDIKNNIMGENLSLNELEKGTLFKQYPDARLHFVLVCGAKGCPPLASYAFKPENLDSALEERTKEVLNLDWFIQPTKKGFDVSQIFSWYKNDFVQASGSVADYLNKYRGDASGGKQRIGFYEYDWSLNE
ncbi:MAG: DUF547 domain-containing protein [Cyclobacteriaceae bacterium]